MVSPVESWNGNTRPRSWFIVYKSAWKIERDDYVKVELEKLPLQGFIQSQTTPKLESTPQARIKTIPTPKFCYVQEVYKMTKVLEEGRENG